MNSKEMKKINTQKSNTIRKINLLKSLVDEYEGRKNKIINNCEHDVVVIYANCYDKIGEVRYGNCLICGKDIRLHNNIEISSNIKFDDNNIVDMSNGETILFMKDNKFTFDKVLYQEILDKFHEMINDENVYNDEQIVNELRNIVTVKKLNYKK